MSAPVISTEMKEAVKVKATETKAADGTKESTSSSTNTNSNTTSSNNNTTNNYY